MALHIVQSPEWGKFKSSYGTPAVRVGEVQYTIHKIPFTSIYYAYCPKVDPLRIDWEPLKASLSENSCIAINFDVPNIIKGSQQESAATAVLSDKCIPAPRETFASSNIILDLTSPDEELLSNMHKKHRYNLGLAQRKGVTVRTGETEEDFDAFYTLLKDTSVRQKYYIHPRIYYKKLWDMLHPVGIVHMLTAYYEEKVLASWMLFIYDNVVYYPYGGSSEEHKNLFASTLVAWETIKLGKEKECHTFDMWGAAKNPEDESDTWHGFTSFKLKFGGKFVDYIGSYDWVLNKPLYDTFNFAQDVRWKILKTLR
ncbi:MAG: Methicillin resistance protein [candidate division WWE3 bacterium GW2011_GWA1_41_8]|uniref:Methicillin resistance protein n=2 Tax=Katanobacteria TaxID=422282 RepID=A0A0G0X7X1_UNCKA|nr:MAG: Methicillin resistance protein [candidate division WWE3 bacterium GW2011_GWB1_41_6]KKS21134.1 MAG: Methicillin resistance protein [candidate division WWE3 bacterium GW2011_GWA1_41_8]